jgi:hypothetical protein
VQISLGVVGGVFTVTAYASVGPVTGVLNVNRPFAVSVRLSQAVATVQVCAGPVGCAATVTAYVSPLGTDLVNVNFVLPVVTVRSSGVVPLIVSSNSNQVPVSPDTLPLTVNAPVPVPPVELFFRPLQAPIRNAIPTTRANVAFLLGIIFVLFSISRSGGAVLVGPVAVCRLPLPLPQSSPTRGTKLLRDCGEFPSR